MIVFATCDTFSFLCHHACFVFPWHVCLHNLPLCSFPNSSMLSHAFFQRPLQHLTEHALLPAFALASNFSSRGGARDVGPLVCPPACACLFLPPASQFLAPPRPLCPALTGTSTLTSACASEWPACAQLFCRAARQDRSAFVRRQLAFRILMSGRPPLQPACLALSQVLFFRRQPVRFLLHDMAGPLGLFTFCTPAPPVIFSWHRLLPACRLSLAALFSSKPSRSFGPQAVSQRALRFAFQRSSQSSASMPFHTRTHTHTRILTAPPGSSLQRLSACLL